MINKLPSGIRFIAASTVGLIGAGISAASSAGSMISAGKMNKRGAKTAKQMQQIGNQFAAEEAQKARDYQTELYEKDWNNRYNQWQEENEYNSAAAQRKRYEEAGLNPFLAMQGQSAGMAQGMSSGTGTSSPYASGSSGFQPNQVDPGPSIMSIGQSVSNAIDSYFKNQKTAVETAREQVGLEYDSRNYEVQLAKALAETNNAETQALASKAQSIYLGLKADEQKVVNRYLPAQQQADFFTKLADMSQKLASGNLSYEQARTEIKKQLQLQAEIAGQKISNKVADSTADSLIRSLNSKQSYEDSYFRSIHSQLPIDMKHYREQRKYWLEEMNYNREVNFRNDYRKSIDKWVNPTTEQAARIVSMIADAFNPISGFMRSNPFGSSKSSKLSRKIPKYSWEK